jgi:hypothetical protein
VTLHRGAHRRLDHGALLGIILLRHPGQDRTEIDLRVRRQPRPQVVHQRTLGDQSLGRQLNKCRHYCSSFAVAHDYVWAGPSFFDKCDVITSDISHDAVVFLSFIDTGRHVGVVVVRAAQLLLVAGLDLVDGGLGPERERIIQVRVRVFGVAAGRAEPEFFLRLLGRGRDMARQDRQVVESRRRLFEFLRIAEQAVLPVRIQPEPLEIRDLAAPIGVHDAFTYV